MGLGDDILVLDRDHRHVQPDHGPGAAGEIAGGRNHVLAGDVALVGLHQPFAVRLLDDAGDRGLAMDGRAAGAGAAGQGLGQVGRLDIAVVGMLDGADQVIDLAQRPDFLDLGGCEEADIDADSLGHPGVIFVLVHPVLGAGQTDIAHAAEADIQLGLGLQGRIEADRVFVHLADGIAHVEQGQ